MAQFKLKRIHVRNWMGVKEQTLDFPDYGLVFVTGVDDASSSFESVGTGKTSIGEALRVAVTGLNQRFSSFGHYSHKEKGNMFVQLDGLLGEQSLSIHMGHRCKELSKTGEGLKFIYGEKTIARSHVDLTRRELCQTLGITPEISPWSIFFDGDDLDFSSLSQTESVELLMAALGQPSWSERQAKAKTTFDELKVTILTTTTSIQTTTRIKQDATIALENQNDLYKKQQERYNKRKVTMAEEKAEKVTQLDLLTKAVAKIDVDRKAIRAEIKQIEDDTAEEFKSIEAEDLKLRTEKVRLSSTVDKIKVKLTPVSFKFNAATTSLHTLKAKPKSCPTCFKEWDKGPSEKDIEKAQDLVNSTRDELEELEDALTKAESLVETKQDEIKVNQQKSLKLNTKNKTRALSDELDELDKSGREHTNQQHELQRQIDILNLGPSETELIESRGIIKEKTKAIATFTADLERLNEELQETQKLSKIVEYWVQAFSPSGIPNMVLSKSITPLNQISTALSHRMSGGTLGISYETTRELASGNDKNCLNIKVDNSRGAVRIRGNSKGESGLTNLIVAETIAEVGRVSSRIGFRWYDEVINGQDSKVRRCILAYLKETAHRLKILTFVVDHHPEVAQFSDYTLHAKKSKEGITSFEWH